MACRSLTVLASAGCILVATGLAGAPAKGEIIAEQRFDGAGTLGYSVTPGSATWAIENGSLVVRGDDAEGAEDLRIHFDFTPVEAEFETILLSFEFVARSLDGPLSSVNTAHAETYPDPLRAEVTPNGSEVPTRFSGNNTDDYFSGQFVVSQPASQYVGTLSVVLTLDRPTDEFVIDNVVYRGVVPEPHAAALLLAPAAALALRRRR